MCQKSYFFDIEESMVCWNQIFEYMQEFPGIFPHFSKQISVE